jgi:DNA-directed RNA polymerase subunit beta
MLTNRGTFIINGTEKNVVPQINRAPGLYVLNKSRVKISGKKVEKKGFVCELLPSRGAFILFDVSSHGIYASIKGAMNDSAPNFRVTEILKALGMSVNAINSVFEGSPMIAKTLTVSPHEVEKEQIYTRENIIDDKLIRSFRADISKGRSVEVTGMQTKIRSLVAEYEKLKNDDAARIKIDAVLDQMICE